MRFETAAPAPNFDFDVSEMRERLTAFHKDEINVQTQQFKGAEIKVDQSGDSTDRVSKQILEALTEPAKARELLASGIPSEGFTVPDKLSQEQIAADPSRAGLREVLEKVAAGEEVSAKEIQDAAGRTKSWAVNNRMITQGFFELIRAAMKRNPA